jgi:acyl-CoA dehydrogenase
MTNFDDLRSPLNFLRANRSSLQHPSLLESEEQWWSTHGLAISNAVDRAGTPWVRTFDRFGARADEILYIPEYFTMLRHGYRAGTVWRALEENSLLPTYELMHTISFHDPGVCCPTPFRSAPPSRLPNTATPPCNPSFFHISSKETIPSGKAPRG